MKPKKSGSVKLGEARRTRVAICQVCGVAITGELFDCPQCETSHHPECFEWLGYCSTYGCTGQPVVAPGAPAPVADLPIGAPIRIGMAAIVCGGRGCELDIPALEKLLMNPDAAVRMAACVELNERKIGARGAAGMLVQVLRDPDRKIARVALEVLSNFPHALLEDVEGALAVAADEHRYATRGIDALFKQLGPLAAPLTPLIILKLKECEPYDRPVWIEALGHIGPKAGVAIPLVAQLTARRVPEVLTSAGPVLLSLGAPAGVVLEAAVAMVESDSASTTVHGLDTMGHLGVRALGAKKIILDCLEPAAWQRIAESSRHYTRSDLVMAAIDALGRLGRGAADCVEAIENAGKLVEDTRQFRVATALKRVQAATTFAPTV